MAGDKLSLESLVQYSLNAVNLIVLAYLVVYAFACPSAALVGAVLFEIVFYMFLLGYRLWRSKHPKSEEHVALESLDTDWKLFGRIRVTHRWITLCASVMVALYLLTDFSALIAAQSGNYDLASRIYERIAPPASQSLHPGFSMELLAGAFIEAKRFERAEPIEFAVYDLRKRLSGERSDLTAAMLANLGDMYAKENDFEKSKDYYLRAIELTKALHLRQGYGSPMTKLGTLYANAGKYVEAQRAFDAAVVIRSQIFGSYSAKVAETIDANASMLQRQGRFDDAALLRHRISKFSKSEDKAQFVTTAIPVAVSVASLFVFWKRYRLLLCAANFVRTHLSK